MLTTDALLLRDVAVQVRDLSTGGCLLETRSYLRVGTIGVLEMEIEGKRRVEWFRICRSQATHGRSGAYLAGAEFLPLGAPGHSSLRGVVGRMRHVRFGGGILGLTGRLSGDPGKFTAVRATVPPATDALPTDLSKQVVQFPRADPGAQTGSQVAESACADPPSSGKSDEGDVHMKKLIVRFVRDDQGQDLIEYVLIGSFVSIGALVGATALGVNLNTWYNRVALWVAGATGAVPAAP